MAKLCAEKSRMQLTNLSEALIVICIWLITLLLLACPAYQAYSQSFSVVAPFNSLYISECWGIDQLYALQKNGDILKYDRSTGEWHFSGAKTRSKNVIVEGDYLYDKDNKTVYNLRTNDKDDLTGIINEAVVEVAVIERDTLFLGMSQT